MARERKMPPLRLWGMLPFHSDSYMFRSSLSTNEAIARLARSGGEYGYFSTMTAVQPKQGEAWQARFRRNIDYRNDFRPIIRVGMQESEKGTLVTLKFRMQRFTQIFCTVFLMPICALGLVLVVVWIRGHSLWGLADIVPFGMIAFMVVLSGSSYRTERDIALAALREQLFLDHGELLLPGNAS